MWPTGKLEPMGLLRDRANKSASTRKGSTMKIITLWALLVSLAFAHTLKGRLDVEGPLSSFDLTTTQLTLTNKNDLASPISGYLKSDGSFSFPGLTAGKYLLEIESIDYLFDSDYRVDVIDDADEEEIKVHKVLYGHDFNKDLGPSQSHPLSITPVRQAQYIFEREEFSVFQMLKNPMMLMSLVSLIIVFVLPKMTANMDPEMIKQLQEQQSQQPNPMEKVQNFDMASYMANKSSTGNSSKQNKKKK